MTAERSEDVRRLSAAVGDLLALSTVPAVWVGKEPSAIVVELVAEKKRQGVAMVAIVHDDEIRHLIADRIVDVTGFAAAA